MWTGPSVRLKIYGTKPQTGLSLACRGVWSETQLHYLLEMTITSTPRLCILISMTIWAIWSKSSIRTFERGKRGTERTHQGSCE